MSEVRVAGEGAFITKCMCSGALQQTVNAAGAYPGFCCVKRTVIDFSHHSLNKVLVYCRKLSRTKLYPFSPGSSEAIGVHFCYLRKKKKRQKDLSPVRLESGTSRPVVQSDTLTSQHPLCVQARHMMFPVLLHDTL